MASAAVEDIEVGFDEAISCLPSHVLDEAIWETNKNKDDVKYYNYHRHRSKLPARPFPLSRASSRRHQKPRYWGNYSASGGPGMQAIFLDSGHKSCGTGVFLPQRAGTNFHSSRRPACSPVLLPSRVVQALNLNVHELGLQISPRRDPRNNSTTRRGELNNSMNNNKNNKNGKDDHHASTKRCVISQSETSSPDIFLPREWTY